MSDILLWYATPVVETSRHSAYRLAPAKRA